MTFLKGMWLPNGSWYVLNISDDWITLINSQWKIQLSLGRSLAKSTYIMVIFIIRSIPGILHEYSRGTSFGCSSQRQLVVGGKPFNESQRSRPREGGLRNLFCVQLFYHKVFTAAQQGKSLLRAVTGLPSCDTRTTLRSRESSRPGGHVLQTTRSRRPTRGRWG